MIFAPLVKKYNTVLITRSRRSVTSRGYQDCKKPYKKKTVIPASPGVLKRQGYKSLGRHKFCVHGV